MLEIGKSFDDQIPELQQGTDLVLQLLQRLGLLAVDIVMAAVAVAVGRMVAKMVVVVQVVRVCGPYDHGRCWRGRPLLPLPLPPLHLPSDGDGGHRCSSAGTPWPRWPGQWCARVQRDGDDSRYSDCGG